MFTPAFSTKIVCQNLPKDVSIYLSHSRFCCFDNADVQMLKIANG